MKIKIGILVVLTTMISLASCNKDGAPKMKTLIDSVSYGIGLQLGQNLQQDSIDLNLDIVVKGIKDGRYKDTSDHALTKEDLRAVFTKFQEEMAKKAEERQKASAGKAKKEGADFMAKYKSQAGVQTTPSGIAYKMIAEGNGVNPTEQDSVVVKFKGFLTDGKMFQSSDQFGGEVGFPLSQVIKGWIEGIQKVKEGGKIELVIPDSLAYGDRSTGTVPPGSTLRFEVELVKVIKK